MVKRSSVKKPKADPVESAFATLQHIIAESERERERPKKKKNPAAVALGRLGGLKGGQARADALSPERRREIAQQGARKRWAGKKGRS